MKLLIHIRNFFWIIWSNFYYKSKKAELHSTQIDSKDRVKNINEIDHLVKKLYRYFNYTKDSIELLGDAIIPPCEAYKQYKEGLLKDDCDGFHSLVYHCLIQSGLRAYLLTAQTNKSGHCVTIFKFEGLWYVVDYNTIYGSCRKLEPSIEEFNTYYESNYLRGDKVIINDLYEYNYTKGKFKLLNFKNTLHIN